MHCDLVREHLQTENFSKQCIDVYLEGTPKSTHKNKVWAINKWKDYCAKWHVDTGAPHLTDLADFLTSLFNQNKFAVSTIRNIKCGIAEMLMDDHKHILGHHRIKCLLSAMNRLNPSLPKLGEDVWDIEKVLKYIEENYPSYKDIPLLQLSEKCATLILLTTMCRKQNLSLMEIAEDRMVQFQDKLIFILGTPTKGYRGPHHRFMQKMTICSFPDRSSQCPYTCVDNYLRRTRPQATCTQLFVTTNTFTPTSKDTIARWVKTVMAKAGIDVKMFGPHTTHAASATKAHFLGMPLDLILDQAGWTNPNSFYRHYFRKVETIPQQSTLSTLFGNRVFEHQKHLHENVPSKDPSMVVTNYALEDSTSQPPQPQRAPSPTPEVITLDSTEPMDEAQIVIPKISKR